MSGIVVLPDLPSELLIEIQLLLPREEQSRLGRCSKLLCKKILDNSDFWLKLVCDRWAHGSVVEHYASFRADGFPIRWKEALYYFEKTLPKKESSMVRATEADSRIRELVFWGGGQHWPKVNVLGEIGLAIERGGWKGKSLSLSFFSQPPEEQGFDQLVYCLGQTNQSFLTNFILEGDFMWAMDSFVDALPQLMDLEYLVLAVGPPEVHRFGGSPFRSKSLHWDLDLFSRFVDIWVESNQHPLTSLKVTGLNDSHCGVAGKLCLVAGRRPTEPLMLCFRGNEFSDAGINVLLSSIEKYASSVLDPSHLDQPVVVVKGGKYESGPAFGIDLSVQTRYEVDYQNKIVRGDSHEYTSSDVSYHSLGRLLSSPVGNLLTSVSYNCQFASVDAIKALVAGAHQAASLIRLAVGNWMQSDNEWCLSSLAGLWEPGAQHQLKVIWLTCSCDGKSRIENNLEDAHNLINFIEKAEWRGKIDVGEDCLHCCVAELLDGGDQCPRQFLKTFGQEMEQEIKGHHGGDANEFAWAVDTKYYSVNLQCRTVASDQYNDDQYGEDIAGAVFLFDSAKDQSFRNHVQPWAKFLAARDLAVSICVDCNRSRYNNASSDNGSEASKVEDWCFDHSVELVHWFPSADDDTSKADKRGLLGADYGLGRVLDSLQAHSWPNMVRKSISMKPIGSNSAGTTAAATASAATTNNDDLPPLASGPVCAQCGVSQEDSASPLRRCGRCKSVFYCGVDCQRTGWAQHKSQCSTTGQSNASTKEEGGGGAPSAESSAAPAGGGIESHLEAHANQFQSLLEEMEAVKGTSDREQRVNQAEKAAQKMLDFLKLAGDVDV